MGEKEKARAAMKRAGVPILPGSEGILASDGEAMEWARQVGFPVIIKASPAAAGAACASCAARKTPPRCSSGVIRSSRIVRHGDLYMEKL